jgi:hypothetical protein
MTIEEIAEIMVQAAEVDRRLPDTARPARLKAMAIPYLHDQKDQNGWGSERYQEERADFFAALSTRLTKNQIGIWEVSMELIKLCQNESQRRALWAWGMAKAGGMSLAKWARNIEHIQPATAEWRAKQAMRSIHQKLSGKDDLHMVSVMNDDLSQGPEISDKTPTVEAWRDEDARPLRCYFDTDIAGLEYAELQNARRRERKARKQQSQAA